MHCNNFKDMSSIVDKKKQFTKLGSFIQDTENQLWDGHPHIYPNLRIFLEAWCDLIIDVGIGLTIKERKEGKSNKEVHQYFDKLASQKKMLSTLQGQQLVVGKDVWSFSLKIRTMECAFKEKGIDTSNWGLTSKKTKKGKKNKKGKEYGLKYNLNKRAHEFTPISENRDEAFAQFEARFGILKILHDGVYKDFFEHVVGKHIDGYVMPNKEDINKILDSYYAALA